MGFWPFGGGKRQRAVEAEDHGRETLLRQAPSNTVAYQEKSAPTMPSAGRSGSKTRREDQSRRLTKTRTPSSKDVSFNQPLRSQTTPVEQRGYAGRIARTGSQLDEKGLYQQNPLSQSSLGPENFTVVRQTPTLYARRGDNDSALLRRKSSKRKAEDYAREREIKAMSSSPIPIPKRPATFYGTGPLQRDSRQIPGALNRKLERPLSEISLPLPGSFPDIQDMPNQNSFKVGILAALSPRPTVRYDANPRNKPGKQPSRPNMAIRKAILEEDVSDKKRINELADDLDAGGLRELMEKDRRRRERKKESDRANLQRKLQRRAERQHEEEAKKTRTAAFVQGSPAGPSRVRGPSISSPSRHGENSRFKQTDVRDEDDPFRDPVAAPTDDAPTPSIRNPFEDEKDMDIMHDIHHTEGEPDSSLAVPVQSPQKDLATNHAPPRKEPSQTTLSPPVSPVNRAVDRSSMSQGSFLNQDLAPEATESSSLERRTSGQSSQRHSSWTTFFRRGTRKNFAGPVHDRSTPSEFSNTSRESVSRKQLPVATPRTFRRTDSGTPHRTRSRFREDLPELPMSPPDSRKQSPEVVFSAATNAGNPTAGDENMSALQAVLTSGEASGAQATDIPHSQPRASADVGAPTSAVSDVPLSQSLASIGSEGSWLSGRPRKRQSGQMSHSVKPSQSSLPIQTPAGNEQDDPDDLMDDDYYSRLSPAPQDRRPSADRRASSTIIDLQQEQEQAEDPEISGPSDQVDEKWHQGVGRQPTVVRQAGRARSKEGLLKEYAGPELRDASSSEDEVEQGSDSPDADVKETPLLRATSVDYKKGHVRHVSAGSAKLLDIRRSSTHSDLSHPKSPISAAHRSDLGLHTEQAEPGPS